MSSVPPSAIQAVRRALAGSLRDAGFRVYDHVPESLSPPCVVLQAADPYVTQGETFGDDWEINLAVFAMVKSGSNERQFNDLDDMLSKLLPHFEGDTGEPWSVEVSAPISWTVNNNDFLGCRIAASNHFQLG